ncbi:MAG: hypothetical protein IK088_09285 [Lachnospiraceae bacterium]|nr:hypothetical protein [Lachnospiraceae bacterium]
MKHHKKTIQDLIFGVIGLVVMNGILSLVVNPLLEKSVDTAFFGKILFFHALATLLGSALGAGVNYARMKVFSSEKTTKNGEYNIAVLIFMGLGVILTLAAILVKGDDAGTFWPLLLLLSAAAVVRYYADVEYRLNLNYKRFALFYVLIGAGYLAGYGLYLVTHLWVLVFLTGELFGILFVVLTGTIFRKPFFETTPKCGAHLKTVGIVSGSFFLSDVVSQADRFLFPILLVNGDEMTSLYYFASVVGKLASLLSTPLNGVITGHIARDEEEMTRKKFAKILALMAAVFVVLTAVCFAGSHLFVWLFYRDSYETVRGLFLLANAGQVIFFVCNTLMVVVLRYTHERNQIIANIAYLVLFFAATVPLIVSFGIYGMAWGILIVNAVKFLVFSALGFVSLGRKKEAKSGAD